MDSRHNQSFMCPLFGHEIPYGECYEVQEIRNDEMDLALAVENFDVTLANKVCEICRGYVVS